MKKVAVIMAGGIGNRLWPKATEHLPKQFIHLTGEGTMIQNTYMRLLTMFRPEDIYVVTLTRMKEIIQDQLPQVPEENLVLEPFAKHTAPCLALTDLVLKDKYDEDTVMIAFPADHTISNVREFQNSIDLAVEFAEARSCITTIGVKPTRAVPDFGYVQLKNSADGIEEYYDRGVRYCTTFAEKPDIGTAERFIEAGDFYWNTGIYIWTLKTFRALFAQYQPENNGLFETLRNRKFAEILPEEIEFVYRQVHAISLDYAILEKAGNIYVIEAGFQWSDLGNWDELYRISFKDSRNNIIDGNVVAINTVNCLISSKEKLIGAVGVKDLIIVDSDEALLICRRGDSDAAKQIVDHLKRRQVHRYL